MRRIGGVWSEVASFRGLCAAARRASRGQRTSLAVARFLDRLEPECLRLEADLEAGTWRPGPTTCFTIHDPKERTITAVPFADRVVHHALIAPLEPAFERRMIDHSYACRRGKGTHAALHHARRLVRRHGWFLKLDIAKFFDSVEHDVVRTTLSRVVKDRRALDLVDRILRGHDGAAVRGLPIGSLTSQWFANLVLDRLDHFVTAQLGIGGYVRYMDDFVLFADEPARLRAALDAVTRFVADELHLGLKARATRLAPTHHGLAFLGWLVFPGTVRVAPANLRRYRWRLRHRRWQLARGRIDGDEYTRSVAAVFQHLGHGHTLAWRRQWLARHALEL